MRSLRTAAAAALAVALAAPLAAQTGKTGQATAPFVVAINHEPDTLDPTISVNTVISRPTMENVIEPLVGVDAEGNLVPGLASWEYSDDGRVLTFTLREGVTFHNGDPLTADDVIFSHERMRERSSIYQSRLRNFDRIEKIDDLTVRLHFRTADVTFLPPRNLSIVSKTYFDRVGEEEFVTHPVGTGPYRFVSHSPAQEMILTANEDYWGGVPEIRDVRFVFASEDSTRVAMLRAGEADLILNVPFMERDRLEAEGFTTRQIAVTPTVSVQFTLNNPDVPWHDVRVRRAIAHAIDADGIVEWLFHGVPARHPRFAPGEIGYDPELTNYEYDPALAREMLAEAGYPNGFDMPLIWWHGENSGLRETAEAVSIYLQQVGISTQVSSLDVPDFIGRLRAARANPSTEDWVGITPTPMAQYFDPTIALAFTYASSSPFSQYNNARFDALVADAVQTVDAEARAPLIVEATRILHDDVPQISLWNNMAVYAMRPGVIYEPGPRHLVRAMISDVSLSE